MRQYGLREDQTMSEEISNGIELTEEEYKNFQEALKFVKRVSKIERVEAKEPTNMEAIVEGLLYIVGEDGIKVENIAEAIHKSIEDTQVILQNIQNKYSLEIYGIELVGYGSNYKFISKKSVYPYAQELFHNAKQNTLSQAALETLAIIAYKQPITRIEIEELRGVSAEMMLRRLLVRNLIREVGRSDAPGRPILYEVTEEFMDSFKLYSLNELPELMNYDTDTGSVDLFEQGDEQ